MVFELNPKYIALSPLVENVERYLDESTQVLYDKRNTIKVVEFAGKQYVIKAFKLPNTINRFAYRYLRPSKAKRSYQYSLKIGAELTPEPIAYIEKTKNGLLNESYYISDYFDYDYTIHQVLTGKSIENREKILRAFADFTFKLHELKILHHDYSHGNILIKNPNDEIPDYTFKIIDINRMEFKSLDLQSRLKNFARIKADDGDMEIIINQYARRLKKPAKELLERAIYYRDEFYRKRELAHKIRGKT